MNTASVSKLKATLSEFLALVKTGEEVIVTERGKPIAKIVPIPRDTSKLSPHLEELVVPVKQTVTYRASFGHVELFQEYRKPLRSK